MRQLPQTFFRDPGGGNHETLPRYRQRFRDLVQEAAQDVSTVPLAAEFQTRILYVSGLPVELQAFVVSDPSQRYYAWYYFLDLTTHIVAIIGIGRQ